MSSIVRFGAIAVASLISVGSAYGQKAGDFGSEAPDFPPGKFSDGRQYRLADLRGKVVVLFFYESKCPKCKGSIPLRNEVVKSLKGKPVVFLAVGASDPAGDVLGYVQQTGLAMPAFIDSLGLMEARYNQAISLQNIWQFRVIGPDGKVAGYAMEKADIEKVVEQTKPKWKYRADGSPAKLAPALDLLEAGRYAEGMKLLAPHRRTSNPDKPLLAAANELFETVRTEVRGWTEEAATAAADDPLKAYDLYAKAEAALPADEVGKAAGVAARPLKTKKPVAAELAARKAFADLELNMSGMVPAQKKAAAQLCKDLVKRYPSTPTAEKAQALAAELGG